MSREGKSKNIYILNGFKFFKRWTVLDVQAITIEVIKDYSSKNKVSTGRALDELIYQSTKRSKDD